MRFVYFPFSARNRLARILACLAPFMAGLAVSAASFLDVSADLARSGVYEANISPGSGRDHSEALQAAADWLAERGGGVVYLPAGSYRASDVTVDGPVEIVGAGRGATVIRAASKGKNVFTLAGDRPGLRHLTVYGTPDEASSGANWEIGGKGRGRWGEGGSALAKHVIAVRGADSAALHQVAAYEARYDPLYIRGTTGLRVSESRFDRAGRNVVSMVGSDEDFLFDTVYVGSRWGVFHFDIEPWPKPGGRYVRRGAFLNCTFDGREAGVNGSDRWAAMFVLSGQYGERNRNIDFIGCTFRDISVRVRGVVPHTRFIGNTFDFTWRRHPFVAVRTSANAALPHAVLRDNRFRTADGGPARAAAGVRFSGETVIGEGNDAVFRDIGVGETPDDFKWEEDHPRVDHPDDIDTSGTVEALDGGGHRVRMPLQWGYGYDLERAEVVHRHCGREDWRACGDLIWYVDPLMAGEGVRLGKGGAPPRARELWGLEPGDTVAVEAEGGRRYRLRIEAFHDWREVTFTIQENNNR